MKKQPIKFRQKSYYNKKTDKLETRFYVGRKRATEEQKRQAIRQNFSRLIVDQLSPEDRKYYGSIKGGKSRQANSLKIDNKFVSNEFVKVNKYRELASLRGFETVQQLFDADPDVLESARQNLISDTGIKIEYHGDEALARIDDFQGKTIKFINIITGEVITMDKLHALEYFDLIQKSLTRRYESYLNTFKVVYPKGGTAMEIYVVSPEQIEEKSKDDLLEDMADADPENAISISDSPGGNKKKKKKTEEKRKDFDYAYKYAYMTKTGKIRHKIGKIKGNDRFDAQAKLKDAKGDDIIVVKMENLTLKKK